MSTASRTFARFMKLSSWTLLVLLITSLAVAGVIVGLVHEGVMGAHDAGQWQVLLDDDDVSGWVMHGDHGVWEGVGALLGLSVAVFCLLVVLPLALLLGVGLPLVVVFFGLGAVIAAVSLPLLVPVLLLVWILRRKPVS